MPIENMNCPICNKKMEISDEEDVYGFLSETGIMGIIGAIILAPIFMFSTIAGVIVGLIVFTLIGYFTYAKNQTEQLYRCHPCSKAYRGNDLQEVPW